MMLLSTNSPRWMFAVKIFTLLSGFLLHSCIFVTSKKNERSMIKNILLISTDINTDQVTFPSDAVYHKENETKLCFNIPANNSNAGCCTKDFSCSTKILHHDKSDSPSKYVLSLNQSNLTIHDIVLVKQLPQQFPCMSPEFNKSTGLILQTHECLKIGVPNIRLSQDGLCGKNTSFDKDICEDLPGTVEPNLQFVLMVDSQNKRCISCLASPNGTPETSITPPAPDGPVSAEDAANIMKNLSSLLLLMGDFNSAAVKMGNITGVLVKLPKQNQTDMSFGFTESGDINILEETKKVVPGFSRRIKIPKEASEMAIKQNGSYVGVLLFPGMYPDEDNSFFFNNDILGIEMGANISNLSQTVDIQFRNVTKNGNVASCISWDGEDTSVWITDGCQTVETNDSITCRCSHLTFFAILMSPIPTNISASDVYTLNQITEVGCGVSMFFLGVALFMHFLIRKNRVSDAAKILVQLFIAMFFLNFCFLINKPIADLRNSAACVAMAAFLHYSMLATFIWFSMQALHLYLSLHKVSAHIRYYMAKIYITGWATPAVIVIVLLGLKKYENVVIHVNDGTSENMCWMSDSAVHFGVNIVYYALVFIFTFSIFILTVVQIVHFGSNAAEPQKNRSTKSKLFCILGLFFLLGISWAFAFFSYGPLLLPSYYVFTVLNSFQGFLLFIYYYFSTKVTPDRQKVPPGSNSITENVYASS